MRRLVTTLAVLGAATAAMAAPPTGDLHVSYSLSGAQTPMTYRVYVPANWTPHARWPLVMALHGFGGNADNPFKWAGDTMRAEADRHGFIIVSPQGYDGKGDWGANLPLPGSGTTGAMARTAQQVALAEADAMAVLERVSRDYRTDRHRVFLIGNSMGMTGALHLAAKYPLKWCAIGPSDGPPWPDFPVADVRYLKGAFFSNGEADKIANIEDTRKLAARFAEAGIDTRFVAVPGGEHSTAWVTTVPAMFDYFAGLDCRK